MGIGGYANLYIVDSLLWHYGGAPETIVKVSQAVVHKVAFRTMQLMDLDIGLVIV